MIDCKLTTNYFREKRRMCGENDCLECSLSSKLNGKNKSCSVFEMCYPDKTVEIIQRWSNEHPKETYLTDFLDKHPNAPLANGIPSEICPYYLGYMTKKEFNECSTNCQDCWNSPIESEVKK